MASQPYADLSPANGRASLSRWMCVCVCVGGGAVHQSRDVSRKDGADLSDEVQGPIEATSSVHVLSAYKHIVNGIYWYRFKGQRFQNSIQCYSYITVGTRDTL